MSAKARISQANSMNGSSSAHSEAARSPGGASSSKSSMTSSPAERTADDEPARKDKRIKRVKKKSKEVRSIIRLAHVLFFVPGTHYT